ncbi:MAG: hypothetical protein ACRCT8_14430 [Lacipirellulaceae bacterium]
MDLLFESPVAVGAIGVLVVTCGAIVWSQSRSRAAAAGLVACVLLAIGGLVFERLWVTPAEGARGAVAALLERVAANDQPGVLALCDAGAAKLRADAQALMPQFNVQNTGTGGEPRIDLDPTGTKATATMKALIKAQHKQSGATVAYFDGLELDLRLVEGAWLVIDYRAAKDWRRESGKLR